MESGTRSCKTTAQCDGSGWIVINHQLSEAEFANDGPFSHLGNARTAGRRSAPCAKVRLDETLTRDYGEIAQSNTNE